ncbi:MAG: energy-coupling factor transporter ATPase [Christensenellaceae bacterium]
MNVIEAHDMKYSYNNETDIRFALSGISLTVKKGEFVAILGHNGSGKSTFAKHMNVLLQAAEGSLHVLGLDANDDENIWKIRRQTGMVFQNPDNQIVSTIVEEDVAFGPENLGVPQQEIIQRVEQSLAAVNMQGFGKRAPHMLSGGQKQRVAIAGVLAMHPEIVVFDEPTAMLDPQGRQEVMDTIRFLNKEQGKTVLLITHYMEEASEADRVFVMSKGKITDSGTPEQVFSHTEILKEAGLMPPIATQVYKDLEQNKIELSRCVVTIDELADELCGIKNQFDIKSKQQSEKQPISNLSKEIAVQIENVNYTYMPGTPFAVQALKNINLNLYSGEFIGLIGHTGCGKSTLIQEISGLLKVDSGTIKINGEDININGYDRKKLRRNVGVVFQYPEYQLFEETVQKDVAFGPKKAGMNEQEIEQSVDHALRLVGFAPEDIKDLSPFDLSGGQKRKVAIAGVLATKPRILILDEPIAGLDPLGRESFMRLIKKLNEEGVTIVMISHNMDGLCDYATRIIAMNNGEVYADGTPKQVFADVEKLKAVGLGASEARTLAYQLKKCGFSNIPDDIIKKDELIAYLTQHYEGKRC